MKTAVALIASVCLIFSLTVFARGDHDGRSADQGPSGTQPRRNCFLFLCFGGGTRTQDSPFARSYGAIQVADASGTYSRGYGFEKSRIVCPGTGSFQWRYQVPRGSFCYSATANTEFLNLIDRSFNKCVAAGARAAGLSMGFGGKFTGKVFHKGFEGDLRHQKKPGNSSLHNVGRAVDIAAVEVSGTRLDYYKVKGNPNGREAKFFNGIRDCWSKEARDASSCRGSQNTTRAGYFGSIGCEDKDHSRHMHLSLPVCDQGGFKIAANEYRMNSIMTFMQFFSDAAYASLPEEDQQIELKLSNGALLKAFAEFAGEPVDEPVAVRIEAKCASGASVVVEEHQSVCDFVSVEENSKTKKIVLGYREPTVKNDQLTCDEALVTKEYDIPCK